MVYILSISLIYFWVLCVTLIATLLSLAQMPARKDNIAHSGHKGGPVGTQPQRAL